MKPRVVTGVVGAFILLLGLAGLLSPWRLLAFLGFGVLDQSQPAAALGEVRATYGGIFLVMGVATLLATLDPFAHRSRLAFVGALWLGACGGRLFGVFADGSPGLLGWLTAFLELMVGGALVLVAATSAPAHATAGAELRRSPAPIRDAG